MSLTRIVGQSLGMSYTAIYVLTVTRLDSLVIGALLAVAVRTRSGLDRYLPWLAGVGFLALATSGIALASTHGVNTHGLGFLVVRFSFVPLVFAALIAWTIAPAGLGALRTMAQASWLRTIGKYSYAMYVLHPILLPDIAAYFPKRLWMRLFTRSSPPWSLSTRWRRWPRLLRR